MSLSDSERFEIMQRRGWKCDRCGGRVNTATGEIHHKDRDPNNNDPTNLRVLCRSCHLAVHGRE